MAKRARVGTISPVLQAATVRTDFSASSGWLTSHHPTVYLVQPWRAWDAENFCILLAGTPTMLGYSLRQYRHSTHICAPLPAASTLQKDSSRNKHIMGRGNIPADGMGRERREESGGDDQSMDDCLSRATSTERMP